MAGCIIQEDSWLHPTGGWLIILQDCWLYPTGRRLTILQDCWLYPTGGWLYPTGGWLAVSYRRVAGCTLQEVGWLYPAEWLAVSYGGFATRM
jgi:hypothetical protein